MYGGRDARFDHRENLLQKRRYALTRFSGYGDISMVDRNSHAEISTTARRFVMEVPTRSFWHEIDEINEIAASKRNERFQSS
jgi:hypothetical protein